MELSAWELVWAGLAVVFMGVAKAGFGGGIGILVTPMLALVIAPSQSVGIMLPILCACDLAAIGHYRRSWDSRKAVVLLPGAIVGIAAGSLALRSFPEEWLGLSIGVIALVFVARHFYQEWRHKDAGAFRPRWGHSLGFGLAAGVTSTLAHAAGPVTTMYFLPQKMDRKCFVGTTVLFYTVVNATKLIPYGCFDIITVDTLKVSLALAIFVPVGVFLGIWMNSRVNEAWFNTVVYVILLLAGVDLILKNFGLL